MSGCLWIRLREVGLALADGRMRPSTPAGQEVLAAEIEAVGFRQIEQADLLKDNYSLLFRKVKP